MTTIAKVTANRLNALHSTGPRSSEGRAAVARNAVRHGIFARVAVLPGECPHSWDLHRAGVVESLVPAGALEVALAERIAQTLWRLARVARFEGETTAAAVEDAAVSADPITDLRLAVFQSKTEEALKHARHRLRLARGELTTASATAAAVMQELLGRAFGVVRLRPWHDDPAHVSEPHFLTWLGLGESDAGRVRWTAGLLLRALGCYSGSIGQSADEFRDELQEFLDGELGRLGREADGAESDIAALTHRAETERERRAATALLPPAEQMDRGVRYEKHLHAMLASTMRELERLQSRRGVGVAPVVADVQVTVNHQLD